MFVDPGVMLGGLFALILVLVGWLALRPQLTRERPGKLLAFVVLFLLPLVALQAGGLAHLERSKSTEFCLSCHVMEPHGRSLEVDDPELEVRLAAIRALGQIGGEEARETLIYALEDERDIIREAAERALNEIEEDEDPLAL